MAREELASDMNCTNNYAFPRDWGSTVLDRLAIKTLAFISPCRRTPTQTPAIPRFAGTSPAHRDLQHRLPQLVAALPH